MTGLNRTGVSEVETDIPDATVVDGLPMEANVTCPKEHHSAIDILAGRFDIEAVVKQYINLILSVISISGNLGDHGQ